MHNTSKDLPDALSYWEDFIEMFRSVIRLVGKKWSRRRLLERCFAVMPALATAHIIKSFSLGTFHEARFGTLWFAVSELVRIEHALRFAWSKGAYNSGSKADGKDDRSLKVDVADEAIRSQTFWGYIFMLDCVGSVFDVPRRAAPRRAAPRRAAHSYV